MLAMIQAWVSLPVKWAVGHPFHHRSLSAQLGIALRPEPPGSVKVDKEGTSCPAVDTFHFWTSWAGMLMKSTSGMRFPTRTIPVSRAIVSAIAGSKAGTQLKSGAERERVKAWSALKPERQKDAWG